MCHGAVTAREVLSGKQGLTQAVLQPGTGPDTQVLTMCTVMLCLCPKLHRNNVGDKPVCLLGALVCAAACGRDVAERMDPCVAMDKFWRAYSLICTQIRLLYQSKSA